jgi:hypothetical protein
MDALSEALNSVRMTGAIFFHAVCAAPWGFSVPAIRKVAHVLAPGTERLVSYHLVTEGKAVARFEGMPALALVAGDIVIIPHGDPHTVFNGSPAKFEAADPLSLARAREAARFARWDAERRLWTAAPRWRSTWPAP